jgi:hypothetical protein
MIVNLKFKGSNDCLNRYAVYDFRNDYLQDFVSTKNYGFINKNDLSLIIKINNRTTRTDLQKIWRRLKNRIMRDMDVFEQLWICKELGI